MSSNKLHLVLVQIIFRHAIRSPDESINYPGDPYKDEKYLPYGKGELTLQGRKQSYNYGLKLRKEYANYLPKDYYAGVVEAHSTEISRARTTLQLVLAALFPPNEQTKIADDLNWQPIPFNYKPIMEDMVLGQVLMLKYKSENNPEFNKSPSSKHILKVLKTNLNWTIESNYQCMILYDTLKTQKEMGFALPEWCKDIFPEKLQHEYALMVTHNFQRSGFVSKMSEGMINQLVDSMKRRLNSNDCPFIYLYSAHDLNLVGLLYILGHFSFETRMPNYMAEIRFELYEDENKQYFVKVLYDAEHGEGSKVLSIGNCKEDLCTLEEFINVLEKWLPK